MEHRTTPRLEEKIAIMRMTVWLESVNDVCKNYDKIKATQMIATTMAACFMADAEFMYNMVKKSKLVETVDIKGAKNLLEIIRAH